jgi:hypothetical protein
LIGQDGLSGFRLNAAPKQTARFLLDGRPVTVDFSVGGISASPSRAIRPVSTWPLAKSGWSSACTRKPALLGRMASPVSASTPRRSKLRASCSMDARSPSISAR